MTDLAMRLGYTEVAMIPSMKRVIGRGFLPLAMFTLLSGMIGCADVVTYGDQSRREGIKNYNQHAYADAAGSFQNAIRQDPRDYEARYYLASSYEQMKQYQQAIQAYKAALDSMQTSLAGKEDKAFRVKILDGLASAIAGSDDRHVEINAIEQRARSQQNAENYFLLGKVYKYGGDADLAVDAYNRAALLDPQNFYIAKEYGLYLEQLNQGHRAEAPLRRAYALNAQDQEVVDALCRIGVVPGPAIKNENELVQPAVPRGPIPEVDLSKIRFGGGDKPQQGATPAPSATPPSPSVEAPRD